MTFKQNSQRNVSWFPTIKLFMADKASNCIRFLVRRAVKETSGGQLSQHTQTPTRYVNSHTPTAVASVEFHPTHRHYMSMCFCFKSHKNMENQANCNNKAMLSAVN